MRRLCNIILSVVLVALGLHPVVTVASPLVDNDSIKQSLWGELSAKHTAQDSIPVLYNLYDLSSRRERPSLGMQIIETAARAGDYTAQLDIIRQMSAYYSAVDSMLEKFGRMVEQIPQSDDQRETKAFIKIYEDYNNARVQTEAERDRSISVMMEQITHPADTTLYSRIENLFALCRHLSNITEGDMLVEYYNQLRVLIDRLPSGSYPLRNMYYTLAALAYTNNGDARRAVEADRQLLSIMDKMEREYHEKGRIYRNYFSNRYLCYRRILSNAKALSPNELEGVYLKLKEMCRKDPDMERDLQKNRRGDIYYLMAKEDYATVLPILVEQYPGARDLNQKLYMLKSLMTAAEATGNREVLNNSATEYCGLLEEYIANKSAERYRELQLTYNLHQLQEKAERLEREKDSEHLASTRRKIYFSFWIAAFLSVLLVVFVRLWSSSRRLTEKLVQSNRSLIEQRDSLEDAKNELTEARERARRADNQRNEFIDNLTHEIIPPVNAITDYASILTECVPDSENETVAGFVTTINHNSAILRSTVNEFLDLASLDSPHLRIAKKPVGINDIVRQACENVRARVAKGVTLEVIPFESDVLVNTDPSRVEQILNALLLNAVKFTKDGFIKVEGRVYKDDKTIEISVADTGCGVPHEMADLIFERYEKLDPHSPGIGLGLSIARRVAQLLGGNVVLDTRYLGEGARFVLILPFRSGS